MNTTLGNKYLYKTFLIFAKYSPYLYAIAQVLALICLKFNISIEVLAFLGGCSIISLIILFLISYTFKFCEKHRIPLYYVLSIYLIKLLDTFFLIGPILRIYFILLGIFILMYLYVWYKNKTILKQIILDNCVKITIVVNNKKIPAQN